MFKNKGLRMVQGRGAGMWSRSALTRGRRALALGVLIFAAMSQAALADSMDEPGGNVAGGCPGPDGDGDGVGDACDNCPNTPAEAATFAQNVFAPIPDPASLATCGTVTTSLSPTITVDYPGTTFGVRVFVSLQHQVYSDVDIKLAHAGTVVTLNPVSSTSQIRNTSDLNGIYRFDDAAGIPLEYAANECFIFECGVVPPGTYHGSGLLGAFVGTPVSGDWTLIVSDGCRLNTGTLNSWSLELIVGHPDQSDYDYDGVGDLCDNCPDSSFSTEALDEVFVPIPDAEPGTCNFVTTELTRTVTVSEHGPVAFMEATLELDHTWYEDLNVQLEHNGTVVTLMSNDLIPPSIFSDLSGTYTFAEYAAETLDEAALNCLLTSCPAIPQGAYRGDEALSAFYGMEARGDWTLTVHDTCFQDSGFLYLWTLNLFVQDASQTDTDGDGMGNACDQCAAGARTGDTEADGDFDLFDYQSMTACMHGVGGPLSSGCDCFDFDADGDVDLMDVRDLELEFQPQPGCRINGVFYQPGQSDAPPFACRTCQPQTNRKDWTMATAGTACRPAAGGCDIAEVCSGTSASCPVDKLQPSHFVCRPAAGACDIAEACDNLSTACPPDLLRPNNYQCRASAGVCDLAEVCNGVSAACPTDAKQPSSVVCSPETGPSGEYLCHDTVRCDGTSATCPFPTIISYDAGRICRPSTTQCDPPEYCVLGGGSCAPDVRWTTGQVCPGASACEFDYTCDAAGSCNPQPTRYRSGSASCRAPANGCDQRDYCGSCDASGNCGGPFNDERTRTDFTDYPECGPDVKKPDGTTCSVGALAGTCSSGECITISNCRYDLDCPDGYLCNGGSCVAATVDHGFGDVCVGKRVCDASSVRPGAFCTFSVDCRDATHPNGNCIPGSRGDCVGRQNGHDLVCCAGMAADGVGYAAAPGQKGRCQECCATDYNDVTATGCGDFQCCDGKCSDTDTDPHNCGGCAYNGGVDCDTLVDACTPIVEGCELGECFLQSACYDANDPFSIYDVCRMNGSYTVPDPQCNYCLPSLTPNPALHNTGCYLDADCGGAAGSCHIVDGRCSPDSARPYEECDPQSPVGDSQCWLSPNLNGSCVGACLFPGFVNGVPTLVHTYNLIVQTDACETPPYSGCGVSCRRDTSLCQNNDDPNDILPANYGDECTSDADCHCGLTCQSSCEYTAGGNPIYFCFSPDTCQSP
ncbi:MAG: proprotein convertase P-domain-containing protein [Planctomycetes bacterium]|nr:proprotein convertase P-domain-containing protein [Planctomycetota bacterium]